MGIPVHAVEASYTDGQSARRHTVHVTADQDGLRILSADGGAIVETWPYAALRLVDEVYADRPIRLKRKSGGERLTIADTAFLDQLVDRARHLRRRDLRKRNLWVRGLSWIGATAAIVVGFWFLLPLAAGPVASVMPLKWEEGLGRSVQKQALAIMAYRSGYCTGKEGQQAIERLVQRFAATRASRYTFRVTVVDSKTENAFAAPGGYIVVFRGLIDGSPNAEAFAGVVAHEMGHVVERHGTEQLVKSIGLGIVLAALIGDTSSFGSIATEVASSLANSSFSREAEREADLIAVQMLNATNITGQGFQQFFQKFARKSPQEGESGDRYFASHPATGERAKFVKRRAKGTGKAMTDPEWQAVKAMCKK